MKHLAVAALVILGGCGYYYPQYAQPDVMQNQETGEFYIPQIPQAGQRFGYVTLHAGVGGIPGQEDISPGPSWTVMLPPAGVIVTTVSAAVVTAGLMFDVLCMSEGSEPPGFSCLALGAVAEGAPGIPLEQGRTVDWQGRMFHVEGVAVDLYFAGSSNRDLSFNGDVHTYGVGLCASLIAGLFEGGRGRLLLGYEYRYLDFEKRSGANNHGPMVGVGLEFSGGGGLAYSTQFRYTITTGDMPQYDLWDFSFGATLYW